MSKTEILDRLVEEGNGYLRTALVLQNGVSKRTLSRYIQERQMERATHGVYMDKDAWPDHYFLLYLRNSRIVFSHESALYLNGLMDREPSTTTVTVPKTYNSTHISKLGVQVIHAKSEWYVVGLTNIQTNFGNTVPVYDRERTICDLVKNKKEFEIQTFQTAMKEYMSSRGKNLGNLISYAKVLGIESEVRMYTEVML